MTGDPDSVGVARIYPLAAVHPTPLSNSARLPLSGSPFFPSRVIFR